MNWFTCVLPIKKVSLFQTGRFQNKSFSEAKPLFPGRRSKEFKVFISEFGISDDLTTGKECLKTELKDLSEELKQAFIPYFSLKGSSLVLKKKSDSEDNQSEIESNNKMYQEASAKLTKVINKVFECILVRTATEYKNYRTSQNHIGCTIYSYVYYSSMKKLSKKIVELLEETLVEFSKSKCNCQLTNKNFKQASCYYLLYSVKAIKTSVTAEVSHYHKYKKIKKDCKPFVHYNIHKIFAFK